MCVQGRTPEVFNVFPSFEQLFKIFGDTGYDTVLECPYLGGYHVTPYSMVGYAYTEYVWKVDEQWLTSSHNYLILRAP